MHMTSCTRLSHFSVCNIEKLVMGLGTRLDKRHHPGLFSIKKIALAAQFLYTVFPREQSLNTRNGDKQADWLLVGDYIFAPLLQ